MPLHLYHLYPPIHVKAGQLFLGVFSGPVEGIIMICGLYVVTGFKGKLIIFVDYSPLLSTLIGPTFWDQKILAVTGLDKVDLVARYIPDIGLNDSFMVFGAFGLAFNILTRSYHIHRCTLTKKNTDDVIAVTPTYTNPVANLINPPSNLSSTLPRSLCPPSSNARG